MGIQGTRFCPISLVDSIESKEIREGRDWEGTRIFEEAVLQ